MLGWFIRSCMVILGMVYSCVHNISPSLDLPSTCSRMRPKDTLIYFEPETAHVQIGKTLEKMPSDCVKIAIENGHL